MATVFDLLDREWAHMVSDRLATKRLGPVRALAGNATTLAGIEHYVRNAGPADADQVLLALVTRAARHDDELAARVLLQLLLPGTRNLARRWWALGDDDERAAAAVGAVYQRIRTYPVERRPGRVAANILLDAAQQLRRAVPKTPTMPYDDPSVLAPAPTAAPAPHPAIELASVLSDAVGDGIISRRDAELIARSRITGERIADIATSSGLKPRTLWDRRQRAEETLATAFAAA